MTKRVVLAAIAATLATGGVLTAQAPAQSPAAPGIAHLVEHVMFEGSEHVKEGEFDGCGEQRHRAEQSLAPLRRRDAQWDEPAVKRSRHRPARREKTSIGR